MIFGIQLVSLIVFIWVYRLTNPIEQQWMRDVLRPEVTAGVITNDELEALVGTRKHRRRFIKSNESRRERRATKHVLEAAHVLADEIAAANGNDTTAVQRARAEVAHVRT